MEEQDSRNKSRRRRRSRNTTTTATTATRPLHAPPPLPRPLRAGQEIPLTTTIHAAVALTSSTSGVECMATEATIASTIAS